MNGKSGDHPLSDILHHGNPVFTPRIDGLVRRLAELVSRQELDGVVDWLSPPPVEELEAVLRERVEAAEARARESGWEEGGGGG